MNPKLTTVKLQVTHGFPVKPSPLFLSNSFPIENRPGLHDQSMELVISQLGGILRGCDGEVTDSSTWPPRTKQQVAKWLSDWHLVAFLCMQGIFSLVGVRAQSAGFLLLLA